jgi:hypothetical protein
MSDWVDGPWTPLDVEGLQSTHQQMIRTRTILRPAAHGGAPCGTTSMVLTRPTPGAISPPPVKPSHGHGGTTTKAPGFWARLLGRRR